jgi:hypothetical protein
MVSQQGSATAVTLQAWLGCLQNRREQMRQTVIVATMTALVTAIIASWGTTIIIAHTEKHPEVATSQKPTAREEPPRSQEPFIEGSSWRQWPSVTDF